jgi:hypothetical protein
MSGLVLFFRCAGPGAVCSWSRALTSLLGLGAHPGWLHHTRLEALSPPWWRVQRTIGGLLCGLEIMVCPRTVLRTEMAAPQRRARECQARERGSTRPCVRLAPLVQEPAWMSNQSRGRGDSRPLGTFACRDAVIQDVAHALSRLSPSMSSEAAGSPPLLPSPWRHCSIAKAVWRLRMS